MPRLQEIYNDAINTVKNNPQTIGIQFGIALTAYKMMQDDPNDDSYDHSYAEVGSKQFQNMSSPAYAKALKVIGGNQTLELMQNPERFWKVYDAFADDPKRQPIEDLKADEKAAYDGKVKDINNKLSDINKQMQDALAQSRALANDDPQRQELAKLNNNLMTQRARQRRALVDAAREQAKRNVALIAADQKNGGLGAVSREELEAELESFNKDPFFTERMDQLGDRAIDAVIADPAKFLEDYRTERALYNELKELRDKKDHKGLVDRMEQLLGDDDESMADIYTNTISAVISEKIPNVGNNKEFDDESKEFIVGFTNELSSRMAKNCVDVKLAKEEMKERVRNGEFPETFLVNDDTKLLNKIGEDLALYQTDAGKKMGIYYTIMNEMLMPGTKTPNHNAKGTINGVEASKYVGKTLTDAITDTYQKEHPEFLEEMNAHADGPEFFIRDQWFYQPPKGRADFDYNRKRAKEGESYFKSMPKLHKKLLDMTPEQLLAFEKEEAAKRALDAEIPGKFKDFNKKADYLIAEMDAKKDNVKQTEQFKDMYAELKNFQNLGTPNFVTSNKVNSKSAVRSAILSRNTVRKSLLRLDLAAKEYEKTDPEFAKKVKGFVWEQRLANKKYLENEPLTDNDFKLIGKAKKVRSNELQGVHFDEYADTVARQQGISGADGKIAQLRRKHKDAQLVFGSKKYDRVGEALKDLETAFKNMEQTEKLRDEKNRQEDTMSNVALHTEVKNVIQCLDVLKGATGDYFEHKKKDGQWVGNNQNANKRIGVVKEIDEFADMLSDIMAKKSKILYDKIAGKLREERAAQQAEQLKAQAEQQALEAQPKKLSPEEEFAKSKESFADEAAEVWLKNKFKSTIDEQIDQKHPDYTEQQRQQVHEQNAGKVGEYVAQNKDALKNDEAFKSFMEGIKNKHDLEDMKQYASADNGSKLYRIINGERVIEKEPADLDKRIKRAQESLETSKSKLKENEFPNPGHGNNFNDYATIVTAYYVKAHKQELGENITNEAFDSLKKEIKSKMVMKNVIKLNKPETLYSKATTDKGQNIWSEYSNKLTKYNEQKKIIEDNKKALENKTLNNGDPTVKPKVLN